MEFLKSTVRLLSQKVTYFLKLFFDSCLRFALVSPLSFDDQEKIFKKYTWDINELNWKTVFIALSANAKNLSRATSVFAILFITLDRAISVIYPFKYNRLMSPLKTRIILILTFVAILLLVACDNINVIYATNAQLELFGYAIYPNNFSSTFVVVLPVILWFSPWLITVKIWNIFVFLCQKFCIYSTIFILILNIVLWSKGLTIVRTSKTSAPLNNSVYQDETKRLNKSMSRIIIVYFVATVPKLLYEAILTYMHFYDLEQPIWMTKFLGALNLIGETLFFAQTAMNFFIYQTLNELKIAEKEKLKRAINLGRRMSKSWKKESIKTTKSLLMVDHGSDDNVSQLTASTERTTYKNMIEPLSNQHL